MLFFKFRIPLRKCRKALLKYDQWLESNQKNLNTNELQYIHEQMSSLASAIQTKNRTEASNLVRTLETATGKHIKRSSFFYATEFVFALIFALCIAIVVRQMWFEFMQIPTGSMRPSFRENDFLAVSKTAFGLNIPLNTNHFLFEPEKVKRGNPIIFSSDGLPLTNSKDSMFGVIPYTKRLIKRLIGKPGDQLYFYGGKIYGIDTDGNPIRELLDDPWMEKIEHIPFINLEGRPWSDGRSINFDLTNQTIGRIETIGFKKFKGEIFNGKEWVTDNPNAQKSTHEKIETYSDIWGIRNFAIARLLTAEQVKTASIAQEIPTEEGVLYLELRHSPSLSYPMHTAHGEGRMQRFILTPNVTLIPLQQHHLETILDGMYTSRFVVKQQRANHIGSNYSSSEPILRGVPDGTYEFIGGKAYQLGLGAIDYTLPDDHPLYAKTPESIQKLFNVGIRFHTVTEPSSQDQTEFPHRYAYFRDGHLYVMGSKILDSNDPTLKNFQDEEMTRQERSTNQKPYIAFRDWGAPVKADGTFDVDFIRTFGLKIPEKHYLMLGDNHANSGDSRWFGFVPEQNLQGAASLVFWPPGERWGWPPQTGYDFISLPRLIVWILATLILGTWWFLHRRKVQKTITKWT